MSAITLWGFDGSTYVRTIRMLLAEKNISEFDYVSVNVLAGEPRMPEHLSRHPFGKVPVLDHDGMRLIETSAIARYLNDVLPGSSLIPDNPKDRARMDMVVALIDSYGYGALMDGVAAFHLFAEFTGGQNAAARQAGVATGRTLVEFIMEIKGGSPFIAGELSLADLYLAPIVAYVAMTPDKDAILAVEGFAEWWRKIEALPSFVTTKPDLQAMFGATQSASAKN
jgi:glutathione S-transferase